MSKHNHNYSQYSNKKRDNNSTRETNTTPRRNEFVQPVPEVKVELVKETINTVSVPETVIGMVVGCAKLNVRSEADISADVVCILDNMSEIEINVNKSTKDWFYICTATGIEGYCMRKYVEAHL